MATDPLSERGRRAYPASVEEKARKAKVGPGTNQIERVQERTKAKRVPLKRLAKKTPKVTPEEISYQENRP